MIEIQNDSPSSNEWAAWFVLLLGLFLVVSTIVVATPALNSTTIWYVLIPGVVIGMLLALMGAIGVRVLRELPETHGEGSLLMYMTISVALGFGMGGSIGAVLGTSAVGGSAGSLLGIVAGMVWWLTARRLTRR